MLMTPLRVLVTMNLRSARVLVIIILILPICLARVMGGCNVPLGRLLCVRLVGTLIGDLLIKG